MSGNDRMREALRDIECRASTTLVHQTDDEDENRRLLTRELDEIERIARSARKAHQTGSEIHTKTNRSQT